MSKKILFFGNERLATGVTTEAPILQALIEAGYDVAALIVAQNEAGHASRQERPLEVAQIAKAHAIPVLSPDNLSDPQTQQQLAAYGAEAAVLVAYGKLVPPSVLDLFPRGIVNLHPSLLPFHRGPTPLESVILDGSHETGVSLMRLAPEMDTGPLYAQQMVSLTAQETKQALANQLSSVGLQLLLDTLPGILDGSAALSSQDDAQATYDDHIDKNDGILDWTKPASRLAREIRAYAGWPRSRTTIGTTPVIITAAHAADNPAEGTLPPGMLYRDDTKQIGFHTADGLLLIDSLIPAGKKEMSAPAFLAGYKPTQST